MCLAHTFNNNFQNAEEKKDVWAHFYFKDF